MFQCQVAVCLFNDTGEHNGLLRVRGASDDELRTARCEDWCVLLPSDSWCAVFATGSAGQLEVCIVSSTEEDGGVEEKFSSDVGVERVRYGSERDWKERDTVASKPGQSEER